MPVQAVLFDFFDTLMLIEKNHEFYIPSLMRVHEVLAKNGLGVTFPIFYNAYIKARNSLYAEANERLEEPHFNKRIENTLRILGYLSKIENKFIADATNAFCEEFIKYVRIDEEALSALKSLKRKYKLGIVSNFAIPECVDKLLKEKGLNSFFDVVIVSAAVNKRKPRPEIFQEALKSLGVDKENVVFVGDTPKADIEGAGSFGLKTIYIERREQKMGRVFPDYVIKSLAELTAAVEEI